MTPAKFPEENQVFKSPSDLPGSCTEIGAYVGQIVGGIFDGSQKVVVAWKPTEEELVTLQEGGSVFLSVVGGLPPHFVCTSFEEATTL